MFWYLFALNISNLLKVDCLVSSTNFLAVLICASIIPVTSLSCVGSSHFDELVTAKGQNKV